MTTNRVTQVFANTIHPSTTTVTDATERAIAAVLEEIPEGGWIDSHYFAKGIFALRAATKGDAADLRQTIDYVQHRLREASHVCRHADGHHYLIHPEAVCSPECDKHRAIRQVAPRPVCPNCFLRVSASGSCSCDD